jgi:flagellar protein FliT
MKVWRTRGNVRKIAPRRIAGNCGRDNSDFPANRELGVLMHETSLAMMDYQHVLDTYAAVSVKSGEMLEAAKASDWNRLVELEQECRALVDALRRDDCTSRDAPRPDPGYIRRKYDLIRKVLADDAQIRRYTEPWMEQLQVFLGSARQEQRLQRAYDNGGRQA